VEAVDELEAERDQQRQAEQDHDELMQRIRGGRDLAAVDSYDEELEMEIEDRVWSRPMPNPSTARDAEGQGAPNAAPTSASCSACRASWSSCRTGWSHSRHKVVILFEGRDAAGKGGVIKRITQRLNPRVCRVAALPAPERPRTHAVVLPALCVAPAGGRRDRAVRPQLVQPRRRRAGDGLLQRRRVRGVLPQRARVREDAGALGHPAHQVLVLDHRRRAALRFLGRIHDPLKQWKLSPMDLESRRRWEEYTKAKEIMLERTHIAEAPWWVVQAVDKKKARLNCIHHLLARCPTRRCRMRRSLLPARERHDNYARQPVPASMYRAGNRY
jgi:polyphosphate kinase 2 (PPK2 family)